MEYGASSTAPSFIQTWYYSERCLRFVVSLGDGFRRTPTSILLQTLRYNEREVFPQSGKILRHLVRLRGRNAEFESDSDPSTGHHRERYKKADKQAGRAPGLEKRSKTIAESCLVSVYEQNIKRHTSRLST